MDIALITDFFMWCTIVNLAFFLIATAFIVFLPDFTYAVQGKLFRISREVHDKAVYYFLAGYKIFFITFSLVPYMALELMQMN